MGNFKANEQPLDKNALDELIKFSGYSVDMILKYETSPENGGAFYIYVRYNKNQIIRQVYSQRKSPRSFKSVERAIDWGKKIGFRSVILNIDYQSYPDI